MMRILLMFLSMMALMLPAHAETLVGGSSNNRISITSNFDGEIITLFGAVEQNEGQTVAVGSSDDISIVVRVVGPNANIVTRKKTFRYGVWLNREKAIFKNVPDFLVINSSGPMDEITDPESIANLKLNYRSNLIGHEDYSQANSIGDFRDALVRIREEQGLYSISEDGVKFLSDRLYAAKIALPAKAASGSYYADTYLFRDGELISERRDIFTVSKTGMERFISRSARLNSLAYGLSCVLLALFVGWFGGVLFRR